MQLYNPYAQGFERHNDAAGPGAHAEAHDSYMTAVASTGPQKRTPLQGLFDDHDSNGPPTDHQSTWAAGDKNTKALSEALRQRLSTSKEGERPARPPDSPRPPKDIKGATEFDTVVRTPLLLPAATVLHQASKIAAVACWYILLVCIQRACPFSTLGSLLLHMGPQLTLRHRGGKLMKEHQATLCAACPHAGSRILASVCAGGGRREAPEVPGGLLFTPQRGGGAAGPPGGRHETLLPRQAHGGAPVCQGEKRPHHVYEPCLVACYRTCKDIQEDLWPICIYRYHEVVPESWQQRDGI